jgi:hypothetical protein
MRNGPSEAQQVICLRFSRSQLTKDFVHRLRKAVGADPSASGATRIAGTTNYKRKYEPDFPTVTIVDAVPGRIVTQAQLEALGLVAPSEPAPPHVIPLRFCRKHTAYASTRNLQPTTRNYPHN